jgi:23S rRNA (guanosine2251-2'-O)-methyltransferase
LISSARGGRRREEIEELCRRHRVACEVVPERELTAVAGPAHNGMAAAVRGEEAPAGQGDRDFVVLVEDVQDPRNLGALLRVCEGAGVGRVLLRDRGTAPVTPAVVKTAAGATEWLTVERITNPASTLQELKEEGFWVYGTDPAGVPPWQLDLSGKLVLCFGGEEKGLRSLTRRTCDGMIGLPMRGRVGSLNIATAAAAVLYEALRQRSLRASVKSG